jgi:hypothetical protein
LARVDRHHDFLDKWLAILKDYDIGTFWIADISKPLLEMISLRPNALNPREMENVLSVHMGIFKRDPSQINSVDVVALFSLFGRFIIAANGDFDPRQYNDDLILLLERVVPDSSRRDDLTGLSELMWFEVKSALFLVHLDPGSDFTWYKDLIDKGFIQTEYHRWLMYLVLERLGFGRDDIEKLKANTHTKGEKRLQFIDFFEDLPGVPGIPYHVDFVQNRKDNDDE